MQHQCTVQTETAPNTVSGGSEGLEWEVGAIFYQDDNIPPCKPTNRIIRMKNNQIKASD